MNPVDSLVRADNNRFLTCKTGILNHTVQKRVLWNITVFMTILTILIFLNGDLEIARNLEPESAWSLNRLF